MATPNNFKITKAIGETDNFAGAEVQFFYITLITADGSTVLDVRNELGYDETMHNVCLLYTSPSPRDQRGSRMPSSA